MKQSLYILAFKNEPLIKIGLSRDTYMRSSTLGLARFDLKNSCLVHARDQSAISALERNLKTFFAAKRVSPSQPLSSGNTETFQSLVFAKMLEAIEALGKVFPDAGFWIEYDLSSLVPIARPALRITSSEWKAKRLDKTTRLLAENIDANERILAVQKELLPKVLVHSIEIVLDDERESHSMMNGKGLSSRDGIGNHEPFFQVTIPSDGLKSLDGGTNSFTSLPVTHRGSPLETTNPMRQLASSGVILVRNSFSASLWIVTRCPPSLAQNWSASRAIIGD